MFASEIQLNPMVHFFLVFRNANISLNICRLCLIFNSKKNKNKKKQRSQQSGIELFDSVWAS